MALNSHRFSPLSHQILHLLSFHSDRYQCLVRSTRASTLSSRENRLLTLPQRHECCKFIETEKKNITEVTVKCQYVSASDVISLFRLIQYNGIVGSSLKLYFRKNQRNCHFRIEVSIFYIHFLSFFGGGAGVEPKQSYLN